MNRRKARISIILALAIIGFSFMIPRNVQAKNAYIGVWKIKGNTIVYQGKKGYYPESGNILYGGKKKKYKLDKKIKCYWFKNGNIHSYTRLSKKEFIKRINKNYSSSDQKFDYGKRHYPQSCYVLIKNKKIVKIWGEYEA